MVSRRGGGSTSIALSRLPPAESTTSQPLVRRRSRMASAPAKSRFSRNRDRSARSRAASASSVASPIGFCLLLLLGFDGLGQLGDELERISDRAQVGHLEFGRRGALVDGDDDLRAFRPYA